MENPMLDFEMEQSEKLKKAFFEGYESGKKDAEYYALHCCDTDDPMTNADRIRSMTDEELSEAFETLQENASFSGAHSSKYWLDWLIEEAKE